MKNDWLSINVYNKYPQVVEYEAKRQTQRIAEEGDGEEEEPAETEAQEAEVSSDERPGLPDGIG